MLKIRVMNISKADLGRTLKRFKGVAWDQSPIFKKLYEAEYGQFGGEPFGALVGDYYLRPHAAGRRDGRPDGAGRRGGALPVHRRRVALGHADGELAGAGQPA